MVPTVGCLDSQLPRAADLPLPPTESAEASAAPASPPRFLPGRSQRRLAAALGSPHPPPLASAAAAVVPTVRCPDSQLPCAAHLPLPPTESAEASAASPRPRLASLAAPTTGHSASPRFAQPLLCQARCSKLTVRQLVRTLECWWIKKESRAHIIIYELGITRA